MKTGPSGWRAGGGWKLSETRKPWNCEKSIASRCRIDPRNWNWIDRSFACTDEEQFWPDAAFDGGAASLGTFKCFLITNLSAFVEQTKLFIRLLKFKLKIPRNVRVRKYYIKHARAIMRMCSNVYFFLILFLTHPNDDDNKKKNKPPVFMWVARRTCAGAGVPRKSHYLSMHNFIVRCIFISPVVRRPAYYPVRISEIFTRVYYVKYCLFGTDAGRRRNLFEQWQYRSPNYYINGRFHRITNDYPC